MKIIIDCADENKLYETADEHGLRAFNEFMMFWFKKVNFEVLKASPIFCRNADISQYMI